MLLQDAFVGSVAVILGSVAALAAALNWEAAYQLRTARRLEKRFGRPAARWFYAVLGIAMLALGIAIYAGLGPNRGG